MISLSKPVLKQDPSALVDTLGVEAVLSAEKAETKFMEKTEAASSTISIAISSSDSSEGTWGQRSLHSGEDLCKFLDVYKSDKQVDESSSSSVQSDEVSSSEISVPTISFEELFLGNSWGSSDFLWTSSHISQHTSTHPSDEWRSLSFNISRNIVYSLDSSVEPSDRDSGYCSASIFSRDDSLSFASSTNSQSGSDTSNVQHEATSCSLCIKVPNYFQSLFRTFQKNAAVVGSVIDAVYKQVRSVLSVNQLRSQICQANKVVEESVETLSLHSLSHRPTSSSLPTLSGQDTPGPSSDKGQKRTIFGLSTKHCDASSTSLNRVASALVNKTLDAFSIGRQEGLSHCCSTNPVNVSCSTYPAPPRNNFYWKKSNKVTPVGLVPENHKPCLSSGQESLHLQPRACVSCRKKCRKLLSQMCSAVSKALRKPFKRMAK